MNHYMRYLEEILPKKDSLKLVKNEAKRFYQIHSLKECYEMGLLLYQSENFQIQEVGIFLLGNCAHEYAEALDFLQDKVSKHKNWKVQEILAMAFDNHCKIIGYEAALPLIEQWLASDCANVRRAASEGLRVWTSRPYFRENPKIAVALLSGRREDESEYVRKSVGNALRDISKKHPDLVAQELATWDVSSQKVRQVYQLASKFLDTITLQ